VIFIINLRSAERYWLLTTVYCLLSGTVVAFTFYGAEAVHTSRTMSVRIKVFARLTLPSKICARRSSGGLCYHGAPFCLAAPCGKE
jgi:hypothetical protein